MAFQMTVLMYEHIHYTMQFVSKSSLCSILQHEPVSCNMNRISQTHKQHRIFQQIVPSTCIQLFHIASMSSHISRLTYHRSCAIWSHTNFVDRGAPQKKTVIFLAGTPARPDLLSLKCCQVSGGQNSPVDMANVSKYPSNTFVLTGFRNFPFNPLSFTPDDLEEHQLTLEQIDEFRGVPTEQGEVKAKFPVIFSILSRSFCDLAPDISG